MFDVTHPENTSNFRLLTNATHYVIIDTCSKVEIVPEADANANVLVCDSLQSFDQFANIQSMVLQTLMN